MAKYANRLTDTLYMAILASALLGTIVSTFSTMASDTTNYSATERALLGVVGIFVVLGLVIAIIKQSGIKK